MYLARGCFVLSSVLLSRRLRPGPSSASPSRLSADRGLFLQLRSSAFGLPDSVVFGCRRTHSVRQLVIAGFGGIESATAVSDDRSASSPAQLSSAAVTAPSVPTCWPSMIASAIREANRRIARRASSLPGDHLVDALGRAVCVDDGDDRDAETIRLLDRDVLFADVDDKHHVRQAAHVLDAGEILHQAFVLRGRA